MVSGLIFEITKAPRDLSIFSYPISVLIAAGLTQVVSFPQSFLGMARSVNFRNNDGANAVTLAINGDLINTINLPASGTFSLNDMWIEEVRVVAGAAGSTVVNAEIVPLEELRK